MERRSLRHALHRGLLTHCLLPLLSHVVSGGDSSRRGGDSNTKSARAAIVVPSGCEQLHLLTHWDFACVASVVNASLRGVGEEGGGLGGVMPSGTPPCPPVVGNAVRLAAVTHALYYDLLSWL